MTKHPFSNPSQVGMPEPKHNRVEPLWPVPTPSRGTIRVSGRAQPWFLSPCERWQTHTALRQWPVNKQAYERVCCGSSALPQPLAHPCVYLPTYHEQPLRLSPNKTDPYHVGCVHRTKYPLVPIPVLPAHPGRPQATSTGSTSTTPTAQAQAQAQRRDGLRVAHELCFVVDLRRLGNL